MLFKEKAWQGLDAKMIEARVMKGGRPVYKKENKMKYSFSMTKMEDFIKKALKHSVEDRPDFSTICVELKGLGQ